MVFGSALGWSAAAGVSYLLAVVLVFVQWRRQRGRAGELEARERELSRAQAELRLLETRAASLADDIEELEEQRRELVAAIPASVRSERKRAALAKRVASRSSHLPVVAVG